MKYSLKNEFKKNLIIEKKKSELGIILEVNPSLLNPELLQQDSNYVEGSSEYDLQIPRNQKVIFIKQKNDENLYVYKTDAKNSLDDLNSSNIEFLYSTYKDPLSGFDNMFKEVFKKNTSFKKSTNQDKSVALSQDINNIFVNSYSTLIKEYFLNYLGNLYSNNDILQNNSFKDVFLSFQREAKEYSKVFIKKIDEYLDKHINDNITINKLNIDVRKIIQAQDYNLEYSNLEDSSDNKIFNKFSRRIDNNFNLEITGLNIGYVPESKDDVNPDSIYGKISAEENDFIKILESITRFIIEKFIYLDDLILLEDSSPENEELFKLTFIKSIVNRYSDVDSSWVESNLTDDNGNLNSSILVRHTFENIDKLVEYLNQDSNDINKIKSLPQKGGGQGEVKGKGEAAIHLISNTKNCFTSQEPDAVINFSSGVKKCSVKSFDSDSVQTGTTMHTELKSAYDELIACLFETTPSNSLNLSLIKKVYSVISKNNSQSADVYRLGSIKVKNNINPDDLMEKYINFKNSIAKEHNADLIIGFKSQKYFYKDTSDQKINEFILVKGVKPDNRVSFVLTEDKLQNDFRRFANNNITRDNTSPWSEFEQYIGMIIFTLNNIKETTEEEQTNPQTPENSSYVPKGKVLKEVYSHLFKKKLISEGGLAGHMMHPYEALDMTPKQIKDRIKKYSTSQKIIEKVDGQNLFFTVEKDGTLMFARNKEDMTHNDLVEKFTNHPAEVPFISGGNAIKRGVDQWLSSAGEFGPQEILEIFHPDGEARSFINFEIMHKDHPNQLEYGENFIVFHSIVDFIDGREAVYSSNNSQRLDKLIKLMKPGVESSDYTLASNRTVDLNSLTNVQISDYISRINKITQMLDINDYEYLGDGVEKQIKKELGAEGVIISDDAIKILYDFALYGEDRLGNKIKSKDFTSLMSPEDVKKLRSINLTNANKAAAKVRSILSPFKDVFVDLGIDLLDGVASSYMSMDIDLANIDKLRDKLQTAIDDLRTYMFNIPEEEWDITVKRLKPHYDKVVNTGVFDTVSTSVEGGVYDHEGDLLKVTGGFAPLNQILGAAYRDKKGIFPTFKQKFMQQESNRRSLKNIYNMLF